MRLHLNYLSDQEKRGMTDNLSFLKTADKANRDNFIALAKSVYEDGPLELYKENGHPSSEWGCNCFEVRFFTLLYFSRNTLTEPALERLGTSHSRNFPYYYAICINEKTRGVFLVSFMDKCSPNWNDIYNMEHALPMEEVDFPILNNEGVVYRMEDNLHKAVNQQRYADHPTFINDEIVKMLVCDQHGNYKYIEGRNVDSVFRDYADNHTGYRDYRRPTASEWSICDPTAKQMFDEWKANAVGLMSDFDKFYSGGIVD